MNKPFLFINTLRLPNIFMLGLVQYLVCQYLLQIYSSTFLLFTMLATILIAMGGYLLNDVQDLEIDRLNHKLKWVNEGNSLIAKRIGFSFIMLGLLCGLIVSIQCSIYLYPWFLLASFLVIVYAYYLSKYKVIGNLIVSFLIAMAILLCFYQGLEQSIFTKKYYSLQLIGVWVYASIAFTLNWIRELVKDLEDLDGDRLCGRKSLPILIGATGTKVIIIFVLLAFVGIFGYISNSVEDNMFQHFYLLSLIVLALIGIIQTAFSKNSTGYKWSSYLLKALMLLGMLLPISNFI
tara:strand:- start:565 stop:1440 length:876 start_codon:yes stop_codon:yes gene_type:complete